MVVGNDDNASTTTPNDMSSDNSYVLWGYENILILLLAHKKLDKFGDLFVTFLTINIEPEEGSEFLRNQPVLLIAVLLPCQFIHIT